VIATLPMYDRPETRPAYDALWGRIRDGLRARGLAAPEGLDHDIHYTTAWRREDLVLSMICNLPLRVLYGADHSDKVTVIGAADYGLPGTPAGHYTSVWVVRDSDPATRVEDCAGHRLALSDAFSHSGWGAPLADATARGVTLSPHLQTGGHLASIAAVAEARADLAAIDAITWRMARRWDSNAATLRPIGQTPTSPGMSFITAGRRDPAPYFDAVAEAIAGLAPDHADATGLRGIVRLPASDYDMPLPPSPWPEPTREPLTASESA
jgi:ABC-type phosphate/phosphonate transport system substrate-binding protein